MQIIQYRPNTYTSNIALICDISGDIRFVAGNDIVDCVGSQFECYKRLTRTYMYTSNESRLGDLDYDYFTVDIHGYRTLYGKVGDYLHALLGKWKPLLDELLAEDLTCSMMQNECRHSVVSALNADVMNCYVNRKLDASRTFAESHISSARLVNIAIPKNYLCTQFFAEAAEQTAHDGDKLSMMSLQHAEQTYDMSDFKFIAMPQGQRCALRKRNDLQVSIVMSDAYGAYSRTLCVDADIDELYELEQYCSITETSSRIILDFIYNPNRTYTITSNTVMSQRSVLSKSTIEVVNADMLGHAGGANMLVEDKYILNDNDALTKITLPQVLANRIVYALPIMQWKHTPYDYGAFKTEATLQWHGYSYLFKPVQCNDTNINPAMFKNADVIEAFGNLHTFMLESNALSGKNDKYYQFHTMTMLEGNGMNFDTAFANVLLPTIHQGIVTFRNLTYKFYRLGQPTSDFDGKRFALVLRSNSGQYNLNWFNCYIAYSYVNNADGANGLPKRYCKETIHWHCNAGEIRPSAYDIIKSMGNNFDTTSVTYTSAYANWRCSNIVAIVPNAYIERKPSANGTYYTTYVHWYDSNNVMLGITGFASSYGARINLDNVTKPEGTTKFRIVLSDGSLLDRCTTKIVSVSALKNIELQTSSNYVVVLLNVDISAILDAKRLGTSLELVEISDFYDCMMAELLPQHLANEITNAQLEYHVECDATLMNIQLQPPYDLEV